MYAIGLGLMGGQVGALSCALVWSHQPFLARLIVLWLVGLVLYSCWLLGLISAVETAYWREDFRLEVAQGIAASLPAVSLALQLPQWLARFYFGWRIEPHGTADSGARKSLAIRDILTGTTVAALTVMALRFFQRDAAEMTTAMWIGWALAASVLAVVSAILTLPLVFLILRGYHPLGAILFMAMGSPAVFGAIIYIITLIDGGPGGPDAEIIAMMLLAGTSCVATTSVPFWLFRCAGYRLKMGRA